MVEEAAGTRMYEVKRQVAQKTIDKKDAKLLELRTVRYITLFENISFTTCTFRFSQKKLVQS